MKKNRESRRLQGMSSFAAACLQIDAFNFTIDLRTHNSKGLDVAVFLPDVLFANELAIQNLLKARFNRGRIELRIRYQPGVGSLEKAAVKSSALSRDWLRFLAECKKNRITLDDDAEIFAGFYLRHCDSNSNSQSRLLTDQQLKRLLKSIEALIDQCHLQRAKEGVKLRAVILKDSKLISMGLSKIGKLVKDQRASIDKSYRSKAQALLKSTGLAIDSQRLHQELALLWQKTDFSEELVRAIHFNVELQANILSGGVVGKRIEFLTQELGRELNTMGAKAQMTQVQMQVVDLKCALDRIREQVLNLE